ncbi:hypothetical protein N0V88_006226 [Collariella sp. IMI 366227]|nr:hypothetical protein N0V88_006226 [Collariella sp. IMI 366227]
MPLKLPSCMNWYKKPDYRDIKEYSTNISSGKRNLSPDGRGNGGIPSRLRLDRILANKTCSPMSLYDFYMYLKYIEYSAENLEFYMWFKSYETSYAKNLPVDEKDIGSISSGSHSTSSITRIKDANSLASIEEREEDDDDDDDDLDSEAELNIPPSLRTRALSALAQNSSPTALKPVADHVYALLKNCSHRNFVRLGVGNGTFETDG